MDIDIMKKKMDEFLDATEDRDFYVSDETTEYMARASLAVLYSLRYLQKFQKSEKMIID